MEGCVSAGISAVATTRSSPQAESKNKNSEFHKLIKFFLAFFLGYGAIQKPMHKWDLDIRQGSIGCDKFLVI